MDKRQKEEAKAKEAEDIAATLALEQEVIEGQKVKQLLSNPLWERMIKQQVSDLHSQWLSTADNDTPTRERIYFQTKAINDLLNGMKSVLDSGVHAKALLNEGNGYGG